MELIILNLTNIIDKTRISKTSLELCCKSLFLLACVKADKIIKKFKANNSTKSQLHQPPQASSCSAHQHPRIIAIYTNIVLYK
jgi:hypothetical protein